ncbi:MAG TPA: flagellar biosynthesis protein FlhA [Gemmatimonadales bacterium]|nr:flagellar biosynthesis protein FlhA [Gemmatimonadales bacterium]
MSAATMSAPAGAGAGAGARVLTAEIWLALAVVMVVGLLVVPLPPMLLDGLLATSIALSVVVLLVTVSTKDPLEFSIFPSLLLLLTLLRLGLNVSTTRLILSEGKAGHVIEAFGSAVIGGNYVVGMVIFLILIVINFMVITKGAGRIAEVAARFTLDAMPGRQMSIDADLGAGIIDENEARRRREEIARYADFYGAMDGAAKFVRGDAVAGLIITAINLVGGFVIGMVQLGLSAGDAARTYTALSVGDGLVSQIPALIVSTAAGIIVTYGSSSPAVGPAIAAQLTRNPGAMWVSSGILATLALVPGFPLPPFILLAGVAGTIAWQAGKRARAAATTTSAAPPPSRPSAADEPKAQMKELMAVEPLELEIGYALVPMVDEAQQGDLLQRIGLMRKQVAVELGIIVPPARIRDNIQLPATEYAIKMRGVKVAGGEIMPRYLLALNTTGVSARLDGVQTTDPSFGMPAVWITPERRLEAEGLGFSVVEAPTVLSTHLMETIKRHAAELLSRQNVRELLDTLKETHPALVEDVTAKLSLGTVHRVLQRLLREGVPIRDLVSILETLSDAGEQTKDPEALTEHVRRALASVIVQLYDDGDGTVRGITVGPGLEAALMNLFSPRPAREGARGLEPDDLAGMLRSLNELVAATKQEGQVRPLITPPALRVGVRRLIEPILPSLPVLSLGELPPQTPIQSLAIWEMNRAA